MSFGFVKNGGMSAEALVFFKPELAAATLYRRKQAGLLLLPLIPAFAAIRAVAGAATRGLRR